MQAHTKHIIRAGKPLGEASRAMVMVHGRGATAQSILSLADHLDVTDFSLQAPQANQNTWYPYSFMAPTVDNEPGLSSGLRVLEELVRDIQDQGIASKDIYFLGFSQGACLTAEFTVRQAQRYGGIFILSGGLIGAELKTENYQGDFAGTPVLLGCSDVDAHIPLQRVKDSTQIFKNLGASVEERIYPQAPHSIFEDEITFVNEVLNK